MGGDTGDVGAEEELHGNFIPFNPGLLPAVACFGVSLLSSSLMALVSSWWSSLPPGKVPVPSSIARGKQTHPCAPAVYEGSRTPAHIAHVISEAF